MGLKKNQPKKKVTILKKPPKMKLMQVWFANPKWVDEALSVQNGIGAVMGAGSLRPILLAISSSFFCVHLKHSKKLLGILGRHLMHITFA
jgi:hypothetical protein